MDRNMDARSVPGTAPLDMDPEAFRALGHRLVDRIAEFLASLPERPAYHSQVPDSARALVGDAALPEAGSDPEALIDRAADLLMSGCRLNGHPRSWGYIVGSPAPLGMLGDFLASAVNPNVVSWTSSPIPSEMEGQAVRWIAELLGYPRDCGGLLVSGGNMANFVGFLAARRARAGWDVRRDGLRGAQSKPLTAYVSAETHTWVQKAADLFGLGTEALRWIPTDGKQRLDVTALRHRIEADRADGFLPFLVVGSAGTVSTGAVDPLPQLATLAKEQGLWFHVDGAYGAPAVGVAGAPADLKGLRAADSVAVDAHKWLYVPLEAGCVLVRDRQALSDTFSYRPIYYHQHNDMGEEVINYHEFGPQNSRCFRALKVWLTLQQAGKTQYLTMIGQDLALSRALFDRLGREPEIETVTQSLSIATFRFVPGDLDPAAEGAAAYLNELNTQVLSRLQTGGEAFLSNAVVDDRFLLRACITNFRSTLGDVERLAEIVPRIGREVDAERRPPALKR